MTDLKREKMEQDEDLVPVETILHGFEDVPILARLEFVKNLVVGNGGDNLSRPSNPSMVLSAEILREVIDVLKTYPKAAGLRAPKP